MDQHSHMDTLVLANQPKCYIYQHSADTGCSLEDPQSVIADRDKESKESMVSARLDDNALSKKLLK